MIKLDKILKSYKTVVLTEKDTAQVYELCQKNTKFYEYSKRIVSLDSIKKDMQSLPLGKEICDKYYVGFYKDNLLCAIIDLIDGYPDNETAYIGFFMTAKQLHRSGTGSKIIKELLNALKENGFMQVRLGVIKENIEAFGFWSKNGFCICGEDIVQEHYTVVPMNIIL